jgi:hypothetical protein
MSTLLRFHVMTDTGQAHIFHLLQFCSVRTQGPHISGSAAQNVDASHRSHRALA